MTASIVDEIASTWLEEIKPAIRNRESPTEVPPTTGESKEVDISQLRSDCEVDFHQLNPEIAEEVTEVVADLADDQAEIDFADQKRRRFGAPIVVYRFAGRLLGERPADL